MRRALLIAALVLLALVAAIGLVARRMLDREAVRSALEQQASAVIGHPVKVASVDWALSMRPRLVLSSIRVGEPPAITVDRIELTTGLRALLSKRVAGAGIVVSGSHLTLPLPIAFAADTPPAPGGAADPAGGATAFAIDSIDRISLEDIELDAHGRRLRLDLESSLEGDRLTVSSLRLQSDRTKVTARGEMVSLEQRQGAFTATADPLDLDELLAIASGLSGPRPPATRSAPATQARAAAQPPLDVRVDIEAPRGRIVGIDFANLATTLALTRGGVTLEPFAVGVFDGKLTGRLHLDTTTTSPQTALSAEVAALDAARLAAFAGSSGVLTGRLSGQVVLGASGTTAANVFETARGRAAVAVTDGTMPGLDLVGPVVLAFGKPDPSKTTASSRAFSRLGGTFTLANGVLQSTDLSLTSRDVDLSGRGTLRVVGAVADVHADLTLSEALSAQAGRDLVRYAREGSRVVLPAIITGPLASPTVFIDIRAAAQRALRNEMEDQIKKAFGRFKKP